jgi:CheY-like chemotaxis protein
MIGSKKAASILIVEDESIVALDMTQQLRSLGYVVVARASSGQQAIDFVREFARMMVSLFSSSHKVFIFAYFGDRR